MAIPQEGLIGIRQIVAPDGIVPISRSSFYALVAAGKAPRPVRISARRVGWRVEDLRAWIKDPTGWRPPDS